MGIKMKILFFGDSVTDAGRSREDLTDLGVGYPKYSAEKIKAAFPEVTFEFVNRGMSGYRTENILEVIETHFVAEKPDLTVFLIGVNDTWHHFSHNIETTAERFESNLRKILTTFRENGSRIVMMEPFMLPNERFDVMLEELDEKIRIERRLAREFADVYVPLHAIFAAECVKRPWQDFSNDGVHPNASGAEYISNHVLAAISPVIKELSEK